MQISHIRKVPQFPHQKGGGITAFFQLLIGIVLWIFMIILFAIGAWAMWFGSSLSFVMGKKRNVVPWWFGWMCTLLLFPITAVVILIAELVKIIHAK